MGESRAPKRKAVLVSGESVVARRLAPRPAPKLPEGALGGSQASASSASSALRTEAREADPGPSAVARAPPGKAAKLKPRTVVVSELERRLEAAAQLCSERSAMKADMERLEKSLGPQLGMLLVADPWDVKRGTETEGINDHDVLHPPNTERLKGRLARTAVQHWAPDCRTFSRALEKEPSGVKRGTGPRPIRSVEHPKGLPWEVLVAQFGVSTAKLIQEKLDRHTRMAELAGAECLKALEAGRYFILENPARSLLWNLPVFRQLAKASGVEWSVLHNCAFGGARRKYTGIMSNIPGLGAILGKLCSARGEHDPCDYTGVPHLAWEATCKEGEVVTVTEGEAEYPAELCKELARGVVQCLASSSALSAKTPFAFIEVFSGPNAPLTSAVKQAFGELQSSKRLANSSGPQAAAGYKPYAAPLGAAVAVHGTEAASPPRSM